MVDLLGPGDAGAARALTTTSDVTSPLAGDTWFGDCVGGVSGTGTPVVSKWLNRGLQQMRRVIRASGLSLAGGNADDDLLGQAIQCGGLTYAVAGGSVNAYTATLSPVPVTLPDGMEINVYFGTANTTTTPTLAANGGSALNILKVGGGAPAAGDVSGPLSLISKAGAWRINGLAPSDINALLGSFGALNNVQQFTTSTRVSMVGNSGNSYTVAGWSPGNYAKKSATSTLIAWLLVPTAAVSSPAAGSATLSIGGTSKGLNIAPSLTSTSSGASGFNGIYTGLGAGNLAVVVNFLRSDSAAWTSIFCPTISDFAYLPTITTASIIIGELGV